MKKHVYYALCVCHNGLHAESYHRQMTRTQVRRALSQYALDGVCSTQHLVRVEVNVSKENFRLMTQKEMDKR